MVATLVADFRKTITTCNSLQDCESCQIRPTVLVPFWIGLLETPPWFGRTDPREAEPDSQSIRNQEQHVETVHTLTTFMQTNTDTHRHIYMHACKDTHKYTVKVIHLAHRQAQSSCTSAAYPPV